VFCFGCSEVSEQCAAVIFRLTELVQVDAEVVWWNRVFQLYRKVSGNWAHDCCGRGKRG
jgi:hypothetical protein